MWRRCFVARRLVGATAPAAVLWVCCATAPAAAPAGAAGPPPPRGPAPRSRRHGHNFHCRTQRPLHHGRNGICPLAPQAVTQGGRRRAWPARGRALEPAPRRLEEEAAGVRAGTGHGGGEKMPHRRSLCWGDNAGWHLSAHQNDCRGAGNGRPTPKRKPCASVGHVGQEVQRGQQRDLHGGHVLWGVLVPSFVAPGHQRRSARS